MTGYQESRKELDSLVEQAEVLLGTGDLARVLELLTRACRFAWLNYAGVFLDRRIESMVEKIADELNQRFPLSPAAGDSGVVFLMTSIHDAGGHSKIAWRWMQADTEQSFSLLLTAQGKSPVPEQLEELQREGRVACHVLEANLAPLERCRAARDALSKAPLIVMNIHPDDVVGAVAAACLRHIARAIFINHAFYTFSVGISFARALACTSPAAVEIAVRERRVSPQHLFWYRNAPEWEAAQISVDPAQLRETLGVPEGAVLLLSSGTEYKFYPLRGRSLFDLVSPVLEDRPNVYLVVVGIRSTKSFFQGPLFDRFKGRIRLIPPVKERELLNYLAACDIYLESAPFHSGGASQQAMLLGKPVINYTEPQAYESYLSPQFFSVDDFSWFHFSVDAYRSDLNALIDSDALRQERGRALREQVSSRVNAASNLASIQESYRRALASPLIADTLLDEAGRVDNPAMHQLQADLAQNFAAYMTPSQKVVASAQKVQSVLRAIAFHLPQFHTIAENNRWWGEGFTEWTNVRQGKPLFEGHDQPREPGELGYYDLSDVQVLARQASLARQYGLEGFCFYYYWFDGQRLLEKPVDQLLRHPEIDLPFCLCWANENWTRRWDGGEQEVLMKQSYSPELNERFALDLLPYMSDPRYIRIDGKPVFLVYRSDIIPDLPATLAAWREAWRANGVGEVYLIGVESFRFFSPQESGFDATCEFLPHQVNIHLIGPDEPINLLSDPAANVGDYGKLADHWVSRPRAPYKRFRGLVPAWDNASRRRKGGATLFVNSSPERYRQWLEQTVAKTLVEFQGQERIIFINAWNEWGEGCYLEPDKRHGRAYLEATRDVLAQSEDTLLEALPLAERLGNQGYQQWIDRNRLTHRQQAQLLERIAGRQPSLVVLVRADVAPTPQALRITLDSLRYQQSRPDEVWVVGAQVADESAGGLPLRSFPQTDWVDVVNAQAAAFEGWLLVLHAGDELVEHGCLLLQQFVGERKGLRACYFDEDWRLPGGGSAKPIFKPDFNLDMLRSFPYTGHALLMQGAALGELGGLEARCADLAGQDFLFRVIEQFGMAAVGHLAEVLVHTGRSLESWLTSATVADLVAQVSGSHLYRLGVAHQIRQGHLPGFNRIQYLAPQKPLVSIIVPTRDQAPMLQRCLESIIERTAYPHYELLVVDNASEAADAVAYLRGLQSLGSEQIRVLPYPHPFNYAAINNFAAGHARGDYLLLLNNDTAVLHDDWLDTLVSLAQRPEVGLVGPKLLYPDGTVQHAGVVLGLRGPADHPFLGQDREAPGYMHRLQVEQNYSALTAACLMIPAALYRELGGMDEESFKVSYNDVDLCLRVREAGYLAVWTPHACLLHEGSVSQRQTDRATREAKRARFVGEQDAFYARWISTVGTDPAYNKNLSLNDSGFEIEGDTGLTWRPVHWHPEPLVLAHPADHAGCGHYRVIQPLSAMLKTGIADGMLSDGLLSVADLQRYSPDVIVLQRQIGEERLEAMRRIKAFSSAFKVYELDDYLPNLPIKSVHRAQMSKDILKVIKRGCSFVDRFVVSTEALADAFSQIHSDIRVVPNRLPMEWWSDLSSQRRRGRKPRVGWAGGVSHSGDLELIVDVVRELAGEVEWVFMGMCPEKIRPYVTEYYVGVAIEGYPARLAALDLDLALAPVEQNLFNECKSNLRLLEYGACGFPVVCSDVRCYRGDLPVTRVKNRYKDWVAAIRMHLDDLDAAAVLGDQLRDRVHADWMLDERQLNEWLAAWSGS